jgi:hypothetical protein
MIQFDVLVFPIPKRRIKKIFALEETTDSKIININGVYGFLHHCSPKLITISCGWNHKHLIRVKYFKEPLGLPITYYKRFDLTEDF